MRRAAARMRELLAICGLSPNFAIAIRTRCRAASASASESRARSLIRIHHLRRGRVRPRRVRSRPDRNLLEICAGASASPTYSSLHDLSLVRHLCQRIAVMYLGRIVELADCDELFDNALHPTPDASRLGGGGAIERGSRPHGWCEGGGAEPDQPAEGSVYPRSIAVERSVRRSCARSELGTGCSASRFRCGG